MTAFGILVTIVLFAGAAKWARWLVDRGIRDGDRPGDAQSGLSLGPDDTLLVEVVNPSGTEVAVGCHTRRRVASNRLQGLIPTLVIRPASRSEQRQLDRGASDFLGAVEAGATRTWRIPSPPGPSRCLVYLGQPGGRLRVHDHAVPQRQTPSSLLPGPARILEGNSRRFHAAAPSDGAGSATDGGSDGQGSAI
jgi:hypothetical protein